jgi:uncharacterized membrane protein
MRGAALATGRSDAPGAVDPVVAALCAVGVVTALGLPLLIWELTVANDRSAGVASALRQLRDDSSGLDLQIGLWWLTFLTAGVLWIRWQQSTHGQLYHAKVKGLLRPPWLSVLAWCLPVVALVVPGLLTGRLLRGARAGPEGDARTAEPALVVWFWWLVFVPGWVVYTIGAFFRFLSRSSVDEDTASSIPTGDIVGLVRTADILLMVGSVLLLLATPLAVVVHLQIERARERTMASWAPPRPDLPERAPLD